MAVNQHSKQWLVGIAIVMGVALMCLTLLNKNFSDKVTGLQPYSELVVVGASGKLESVESPTLQREGVRRISYLEVVSKEGLHYNCRPTKFGLMCRPMQPNKR